MIEYKTIRYENLIDFDKACNELAKEEWTPLFNMNTNLIIVEGDTMAVYSQQWMRIK